MNTPKRKETESSSVSETRTPKKKLKRTPSPAPSPMQAGTQTSPKEHSGPSKAALDEFRTTIHDILMKDLEKRADKREAMISMALLNGKANEL